MGKLKAENVRDDFTFVIEVVQEPEWVTETIQLKAPNEDGDTSFDVTDLIYKYRHVYPEGRDGADSTEKTMKFRASKGQAEDLDNGGTPKMNPKSVLGRLTADLKNCGLGFDPDDAEIQGQFFVITRESGKPNKSGWTELMHTVVAAIGDRETFDIDRGKELADLANSSTKVEAVDGATY